jgi:prevent-host-death family protein
LVNQSENVATMEKATVGIRELEDKASSIIDRVEAGEAITVTKHGRPVTRIVSSSLPADQAGQTPRPGQERRGVRLRGSALSLYLDTSA